MNRGRAFAALAVLAAFAAGPAVAAELVMFESARCPWCVKWHRELGPVYPQTDEGRMLALRRVEHPGTMPRDIQVAVPVKYTPTFVVIDCGREAGRVVGYASQEQFWGELSGIIEKLKTDGRPKPDC